MESKIQTAQGEYTEAELSAAFALVQNPENWKRSINAVVPNDEATLRVIRAAVPFYTGSTVHESPAKGGKVRVRALGYYAVIGA